MSSGADRAIRVSTAAAVLGVAGIAAYVSYQHAFEVVPGSRGKRPDRAAGTGHHRRLGVLLLHGDPLRGPTLAARTRLGPMATGVRHPGHPGGERGTRLVRWASRRRRRGLARRQPRRQL